MSITKETIVDKIEIVGEYKKLNIREAIVIKENGTEIARNLHRRVIAPSGSNSSISASLATENSEIRDVANVVWTDTIKTNYNNFIVSSSNEIP